MPRVSVKGRARVSTLPWYKIMQGDVMERLRQIESDSVQCVVTSPPYWGLRDYKCDGQIGLEKTVGEYIDRVVAVFEEVRRVLHPNGTLWLNLGDSYAGSGCGGNPPNSPHTKQSSNHGTICRSKRRNDGLKPKDLIGIPWRVAFALQDAGWWLRSDIIWAKPNCMPESMTDRPTRSHEYIFLLTKSARYYYDNKAIMEEGTLVTMARINQPNFDNQTGGEKDYGPESNRSHRRVLENIAKKIKISDKQRGHSRRHAGFNERWDAMPKEQQCGMMRNKRDVWHVATEPFPEAHFATFPPRLIHPCILAGSRPGDVVLDPFVGSGTTLEVACAEGRNAIGIELNPDYVSMARRRVQRTCGLIVEERDAG